MSKATWQGDSGILPIGQPVQILARDDAGCIDNGDAPARTACWVRAKLEGSDRWRYRSCDLVDLDVETPTNAAPVKVEQCDRVAATALWQFMQDQGPVVEAEGGRAIGREMLQAFARHRLSALASAPAGLTANTMDVAEGVCAPMKALSPNYDPLNPLVRDNLARWILDGWTNGNEQWETASEPMQEMAEYAAQAVVDGIRADMESNEPAAAPAGDGVEGALRNLVALYDSDEGCQSLPEIVVAKAALARPRAAVGEREATFDPIAYGAFVLSAMRGQSCREVASVIGISAATLNRVTRGGMPDLPTYFAIREWLALQSPPAKVEGV